ncbi:hypothetical protein [Corynebacterium rouxii]|uniref:hypothetical protein n=1 Tax=Corynebacterium rouxii TaxID=2719119 RepID=UPI00313B6F5F
MMDPVIKLVAHAQEMSMTIPRRQACMVYGKLNVTLKKGDVQEERDKRVTDGYVHIPEDMPQGRFDFGFTREDADINIGTGQSTYELALDTAARRITGQVLFEQDIIAPGFGDWRPLIDFSCGDLVGVRIWGKELVLPVTSITRGTTGWRAHVGGQLINDRRKIVAENRKILADIESERRERMNEIGAISSVASAAKDAAKAADRKAEGADSKAEAADAKAVTADGKAEDALQKWRDEKDRLDAFQTQQIHELAAYQAAIRRMVALQEPISGDISTYDPLVLGPVTITYPHRSTLKVEMTNFEFLTGVSVVMNARVDALSPYSWGTAARLSQRTPVATRSTGAIEYFLAANILVIPTADFSALLAQERKNRGLE